MRLRAARRSSYEARATRAWFGVASRPPSVARSGEISFGSERVECLGEREYQARTTGVTCEEVIGDLVMSALVIGDSVNYSLVKVGTLGELLDGVDSRLLDEGRVLQHSVDESANE